MKDTLFLENCYILLSQGYNVEDTLLLCEEITHHKACRDILNKVSNGQDFSQALLEADISHLFKEFYGFFTLKLSLSEAIKNALSITKLLDGHRQRLIKELSYPLILLVFMLIFSLFSTVVLFPRVNQLFSSFGIELSLMVKIAFFCIRIIPILVILIGFVLIVICLSVMHALQHHHFQLFERYLHIPAAKWCIQKYFTLKFSIYFNELIKDNLDANAIITLLNEKMMDSDLKMIVYEIYRLIIEGHAFIDILKDFPYIDPMFTSMYMMYINHPDEINALDSYIDICYSQINHLINRIIKIITPSVYAFVSVSVITVYLGIILPLMNIINDL